MPTPTFSPGHVLADRYIIDRLLGVGRTAEVYLAEDSSLQRTVVVKVLLAELAEHAEVRRAFRDHIVRAATISHPHIARVYDGGQEDGAIFLITEYLSGGSLEDAFRSGLILAVDDAAKLGRDVAAALANAHEAGFVHGNVSPAKLLFDDEGHVRLSDIALAGLADGYREEFSLNDARYLSPEQAVGEAPTDKSDVYALALILFEAVTGAPAFEGASTNDVLRARIDAPLPVRSDLGTLDMLLAQAAIAQPEYRLDAETFANRLGAVVSDPSDFVLPLTPPTSGILQQFQPSEARTTIGFRVPSAEEVSGVTQAVPTAFPRPQAVRVNDSFDRTAAREGVRRGREIADVVEGTPRRRFAFFLVALLLVLGGAGAGAAWKLGLFTQSHTVPSLVGLSTQQAATLVKGDGFTLSVTQHENSATVAVNDIVSQSPAPGTTKKGGLTITVSVSDGPQMVTLPTNVIGEDCVSATAQLEKLKIGASCPSSAAITSQVVPAGRVARVLYQGTANPVAVPLNATVTLALSSGTGATSGTGSATTTTLATNTVPNLVGMNYTQVVAALQSAGYFFRTEGLGAGTSTWTNVTAQSPAAGTHLAKKGTITLHVSGATTTTATSTKAPTTTTTTKAAPATTTTRATAGEFPMPNVAGMTRSQVFAVMAKDKLYFSTRGPGAGTNNWRYVVSSQPAAGTLVKPLSAVVLYVKE